MKDLTVEELRSLILDAIREGLEDLIEDLMALSSEEYLQSIREARDHYRRRRVKPPRKSAKHREVSTREGAEGLEKHR